jgi:hypothetical protein
MKRGLPQLGYQKSFSPLFISQQLLGFKDTSLRKLKVESQKSSNDKRIERKGIGG